MTFHQDITDALDRRVGARGGSDRYLVGGVARPLLTEAQRRLDPGDVDVAELVELLDEAARDWGPKLGRKPEDMYHWAAARLLAQVFLDPQEEETLPVPADTDTER